MDNVASKTKHSHTNHDRKPRGADETEDAATFLGALDPRALSDASIYWMGQERGCMETNDLDGIEFAQTWLERITAEIARRGGGDAR
jgi:hypothetical protein